MELIDFDGLFEEKLSEYMHKNANKYTEAQWETLIPKLYRQFGETYIPCAGNTPKGYFAAMDDASLVALLMRYIGEGVPVPDYLCRELECRPHAAIMPLLKSENDTLVMLAVNMIGGDEEAFESYFSLLEKESTPEDIAEAIGDQLKSNPDAARKTAKEYFYKGIRSDLMLDVLSRVRARDDEVFDILLRAFKENEDIALGAGYLAQYQDARALPALYEMIVRDDITEIEFRELKYAIEALGGESPRAAF